MNIFKGTMPKITAAQVAAALTWIVAQAVASGWVDNDTAQSIIQIGSTAITGIWILGDAVLRGLRALAISKAHPDTAAKMLDK